MVGHTRDSRDRPALICVCDCKGTRGEFQVRPAHFVNGEVRSCNCLRRELRKATAYPKGSKRFRGANPYKPQDPNRIILDHVSDVILPAQADYLPLTVRQIYYLLVAAGVVPKSNTRYADLTRIIARERRAGRIPFDAIRDDGQHTYASELFTSPSHFWDSVHVAADGYRLDRQAGQERYVELWAETAGMAPQLARVTDPFSVPIWTGGGQTSVTARRQIADRALERDVPTLILHVGDLDPHGKIIYNVLIEDAADWLCGVGGLGGQYPLEGRRLALTPEQVAEYELTDDDGKVQLEALTPKQLAKIIRDALTELFDAGVLDQQVAAEDDDRGEVVAGVRRARRPPRHDGPPLSTIAGGWAAR